MGGRRSGRPSIVSREEADALRSSRGALLALDLTAAAKRYFDDPDLRVHRLADGRVLCDDGAFFPIVYESEARLVESMAHDVDADWDRPWGGRRGIDVVDRNYLATLVRASIADVTALLAPLASVCLVDVLDRDVPASDQAVIAFQIEGHPWTVVLQTPAAVDRALLKASRTLGWSLLEFVCSDTMGTMGYRVIEHGLTTERLDFEEGAPPVFESNEGDLDEGDAEHPRGRAARIFAARDAYVPDLVFGHFVPQEDDRRAETWRLVTPRLVLQGRSSATTTTPPFAGVRYFHFPR